MRKKMTKSRGREDGNERNLQNCREKRVYDLTKVRKYDLLESVHVLNVHEIGSFEEERETTIAQISGDHQPLRADGDDSVGGEERYYQTEEYSIRLA